MYKPPDQNIIAKLIGIDVMSVTFGRFMINIGLNDGSKISFASPFRFDTTDSIAQAKIQEFPLTWSSIMRINASVIVAIDTDIDGTLNIKFNNGDSLIVYANDPRYEAYSLFIDDKEYLV